MRESFIIYKSFIDSGKEIKNKNDRLAFYEAIFNFAIFGEELELSGVAKAMFMLVKPILLANQKRYENGNKGGKSVTKPEPKPNLDLTKPEPNKDKDYNKDKYKDKDEDKYDTSLLNLISENIKLSIQEFEKLCTDYSQEKTEEAIKYLSNYKIEKGYKSKSDNLTLRRWVFEAISKNQKKQIQTDREQTIGGIKISEYQKLADKI